MAAAERDSATAALATVSERGSEAFEGGAAASQRLERCRTDLVGACEAADTLRCEKTALLQDKVG